MNNTELQARDIDTLKSNVARLGAYVNANELIQTFGIARSTLLKLRKTGAFPKGIRIGRVLRWAVSDIQAWIDQQAEARA